MKYFFLLFIGFPCWAQDVSLTADRNPAQALSEREAMERAKSKNYRGGAEEGELRVQAQLVKTQRKITPAVDKKEMDKETQDHD